MRQTYKETEKERQTTRCSHRHGKRNETMRQREQDRFFSDETDNEIHDCEHRRGPDVVHAPVILTGFKNQ